jgi:hypothetical protein
MEHEMEINVIAGHSIRPPAGYTTLTTYILAEFGYPTANPVKIQTASIANSLSPQYNLSMKVFIDRNKTFQRFVEKKKIVLTIYHSRFLLSDVVRVFSYLGCLVLICDHFTADWKSRVEIGWIVGKSRRP